MVSCDLGRRRMLPHHRVVDAPARRPAGGGVPPRPLGEPEGGRRAPRLRGPQLSGRRGGRAALRRHRVGPRREPAAGRGGELHPLLEGGGLVQQRRVAAPGAPRGGRLRADPVHPRTARPRPGTRRRRGLPPRRRGGRPTSHVRAAGGGAAAAYRPAGVAPGAALRVPVRGGGRAPLPSGAARAPCRAVAVWVVRVHVHEDLVAAGAPPVVHLHEDRHRGTVGGAVL